MNLSFTEVTGNPVSESRLSLFVGALWFNCLNKKVGIVHGFVFYGQEACRRGQNWASPMSHKFKTLEQTRKTSKFFFSETRKCKALIFGM